MRASLGRCGALGAALMSCVGALGAPVVRFESAASRGPESINPVAITVTLSNPQNASLGDITRHTLTILDFEPPLTTVRVAHGLEKPLLVTAPPGDCERIFIVGQEGTIQLMKQTYDGGTPTLTMQPAPFLDLTSVVSDTNLISHGRGEQGLLGLAFHPDYARNGYFYVSYTEHNASDWRNADSVIARYTVSAGDPDVADTGTAVEILRIDNPTENHNGGMIAFGPNDGYLYFSTGIMQGSGGNGLDLTLLKGKVLRIDVDGGSPYAIPPDNPFVGVGGGVREEIWASGLRQPWRFSFDRANGDMYIGDVGGGGPEELSYQPGTSIGGENYGFNIMEGNDCIGFGPGCADTGCVTTGLTLPIHDRCHGQIGAPKEAIIGGYVYRGTRIDGLTGTYFFGDWTGPATGACAPAGPSKIWSLRVVGGAITDFRDRTAELDPGGGMMINNLTSFGEDAAGGLYLCSRGDINTSSCPRPRFLGEVYKIVATDDPQPLLICNAVEPAPTPSVSGGGVFVLVLSVLAAGSIVLARRRPRMA